MERNRTNWYFVLKDFQGIQALRSVVSTCAMTSIYVVRSKQDGHFSAETCKFNLLSVYNFKNKHIAEFTEEMNFVAIISWITKAN